jgi:hypothetical protein
LRTETNETLALHLDELTHIRDGDALVLANGSLVLVVADGEVLRQMPFPKFNRDLHTLSKGNLFKIEERPGVAGVRTYVIDRSTHYPKNLSVLEVPEQRTDSIYQKQPTNEQQQ